MSRVTPQVVGVLVLAVCVVLVIAWVIRRGGAGDSGGDTLLPSIAQLAAGPIASDVLEGSGPTDVRSVALVTYDAGAALPSEGGEVPLPMEAEGPDVERVAEGGNSGLDASVAGDWRIRICRSPASRKQDFDRAAAYLKARGVETDTELRSKFYFLYSRQTFPSKQHPLCVALLKRIIELGGAFARESGTNTDFHDAYALKKRSRN